MGKIYDQFKISESRFPKNRFTGRVGLVKFELDGKNYEVFFARKRANKYSTVHCKNSTVEWEQFPILPRIAGRNSGKREPIISFAPDKDRVRIFIIKGKPNCITGLDEGIFRSVHRYDENYINVMSEARFKEI